MESKHLEHPQSGVKVEIECDKNWILEPISPWNGGNPKRWKNYMGVVTRNEDGKFQYQWLKESRESDEWFNITDVKEGDILMVGVKDCYHPNRPSEKMYYMVMERTEDKMVLIGDTTYRKVSMVKDDCETIEEV